jgi:hypothetical protein
VALAVDVQETFSEGSQKRFVGKFPAQGFQQAGQALGLEGYDVLHIL